MVQLHGLGHYIIDPVFALNSSDLRLQTGETMAMGYRPRLGNRRLIYKGIFIQPGHNLGGFFLNILVSNIESAIFCKMRKMQVKNHSACSALQLVKGATASLHFQGQVWAWSMNAVKAAGGTKAIHL